MNIDRDNFTMRAPCSRCGGGLGRIEERSGQDCVFCLGCGKHSYNAPRGETGRPVRHVKTRENVKPGKRAAILLRDGAACVLCRAADEHMHVGHIISVDAGLLAGMTQDELDDEENLAVMCEACNLGIGSQPLPLRTAIAIVRARISWRNRSAS
jgi:5-methylcytosine-specific restriction endonuclease McrA